MSIIFKNLMNTRGKSIIPLAKKQSFTDLYINKPKNFLTTSEAAEYLGVSKQTLEVWRCVKRYDIPYIKIGRLVKYKKEDLDTFIKKRTIGKNDEN